MILQIFELQAEILKALGNPRRLEILNLLSINDLNVRHMEEMLSLPQANLSQHLSVLRKNKIVKVTREGKEMVYSLYSDDVKDGLLSFRNLAIALTEDKELISLMRRGLKDELPIVTDPVCKMRISTKEALFSTKYKMCEYHFCASGCQHKFINHPEKYV